MSRPPRFFISPDQIHGNQISVSGEDVRHILTVLRMKSDETLVLCDGTGAEYTVSIKQVGRSEINTEIISETKRPLPHPRVVLGQGLPKSDKMDWIVQKATELGVAKIIPLVTERTIVKIKDEQKRVARWQKIVCEAAMQSSRADIPQVGRIVLYRDFIMTQTPGPSALLLLPWEEGTQPIKEVLGSNKGMETIVVLIGPEGGFSAAEADLARGRGFHQVSLGPNILRTETAAVAVLSMILYEASTNNQIPSTKQ